MRKKKRTPVAFALQATGTGSRRQDWHPPANPAATATTAQRLRLQARWSWTAMLLLLSLSALPSLAQNSTEVGISLNNVQSGSLLLQMQSGFRVATRINTDIGINVSGLLARVAVKQAFRNDGSNWAEGVYVFPLPDDAAVDHMRIWVGERFIEGEIREKEQAKKDYEKAKAAGKKASLVEQQRVNLFTTSVANIAPGETVTIEVEYLQTVNFRDNAFSMRVPLTLTPRFIPGAALSGRQGAGWSPDTNRVPDASLITPPQVINATDHRLTLTAAINSGVALQEIISRYHPIQVSEEFGRYTVALASADVPMDHDFELVWKPVPAESPRAMLFAETVSNEQHLLLMVLPPDTATVPTAALHREMLFVIDTSGSMHGLSIEQAKKSLQLALRGLRPTDRFNVIQFNSTTGSLFPVSIDATSENIELAKDYVGRLTANGGTNMRPALQMALNAAVYPTHLRQVVFITDGSVGNEAELFSVIESDLGTARLFTVGIGAAPNGWFMRKSAAIGRGTYTYISTLNEVSEKMTTLFGKIENPQVTNIEIIWPQGVETEVYPENVADLYAGEPVVVKARMTGMPRAADLVSISGDSAVGGWNRTLALADNVASFGVGALWARAKIAALLDEERRSRNAAEIRDAIVETALQHHLVSKYTSLVAVDKTPVRPTSAPLDRQPVPNLLPHGQSQNAIFGFPATATDALAHRLAGYACLLLALLLTLTAKRKKWVA